MVFFCSLKIFILAALKFLSVKPNIWLLHMQFLCLLTFWRRGHTLFLYTFYLFFEIKHFQAALGTVSPLSFWTCYLYVCRFPTWLNGKESTCSADSMGLVPGWEDPLEKEMATHFSILAWKIPWTWTEEPGGQQSMGLQKSHTWLSD